jgi:hypothetical protein
MKMKREVCILLSHSKMKLLGCSLNFNVWNPKRLPFMLDFIRSTGGRYMICLVWIYLDLVYQLDCLRYDIRRLCDLVFHFSDFFEFCAHPFVSSSNPRFDQDNLNKFKTWKCKGKHVSFLVTLKWSFWEVFEISMFETQNHFSSHAWLHKTEFRG